MTALAENELRIYTIGHSTLAWDAFVTLLQAFQIEKLIDVRSMPGSRYVPHFNQETLSVALAREDIAYGHIPNLGGRRKSANPQDAAHMQGWKNSSFRNYAAYTLTPDYEAGLRELLAEAKKRRVCIMCAESVPWRCHRLLISNTLFARGISVFHIMGKEQCPAHTWNRYGAYAEIHGEKVLYPPLEGGYSK